MAAGSTGPWRRGRAQGQSANSDLRRPRRGCAHVGVHKATFVPPSPGKTLPILCIQFCIQRRTVRLHSFSLCIEDMTVPPTCCNKSSGSCVCGKRPHGPLHRPLLTGPPSSYPSPLLVRQAVGAAMHLRARRPGEHDPRPSLLMPYVSGFPRTPLPR